MTHFLLFTSNNVNYYSLPLFMQNPERYIFSRQTNNTASLFQILEPRESSYNSDLSNLSYGLRNSFNSTSLPAVHVRTDLHKTSSNSSQEWMDGGVQEYRGTVKLYYNMNQNTLISNIKLDIRHENNIIPLDIRFSLNDKTQVNLSFS